MDEHSVLWLLLRWFFILLTINTITVSFFLNITALNWNIKINSLKTKLKIDFMLCLFFFKFQLAEIVQFQIVNFFDGKYVIIGFDNFLEKKAYHLTKEFILLILNCLQNKMVCIYKRCKLMYRNWLQMSVITSIHTCECLCIEKIFKIILFGHHVRRLFKWVHVHLYMYTNNFGRIFIFYWSN